MGRIYVAATAAMLVSVTAIAQTLSYSQAKARADDSEGRLGASDMRRLIEIQGKFARSAFAQCIGQTGASPSDFTVVVELKTDGRVRGAWLQGDTLFAQCFRDRMVADFAFRPPSVPFFSSFEYSNAR